MPPWLRAAVARPKRPPGESGDSEAGGLGAPESAPARETSTVGSVRVQATSGCVGESPATLEPGTHLPGSHPLLLPKGPTFDRLSRGHHSRVNQGCGASRRGFWLHRELILPFRN